MTILNQTLLISVVACVVVVFTIAAIENHFRKN